MTKLIPTHETAPLFLYNPIILATYSWINFIDGILETSLDYVFALQLHSFTFLTEYI